MEQTTVAEQRPFAVAKLKWAASLPRMKDGWRPPMHVEAVSEGSADVLGWTGIVPSSETTLACAVDKPSDFRIIQKFYQVLRECLERRNLRIEGPSPYFDPLSPRTSSDEYKSPYSLATSPSRSSSPSSLHYHSTGTSSSPGSSNLSPLRAPLPIPTFQHMALTSQSTANSLSPSSPGYHEFQSYSHELPGDLRTHNPVSQTIPVDKSCLATCWTVACNGHVTRSR